MYGWVSYANGYRLYNQIEIKNTSKLTCGAKTFFIKLKDKIQFSGFIMNFFRVYKLTLIICRERKNTFVYLNIIDLNYIYVIFVFTLHLMRVILWTRNKLIIKRQIWFVFLSVIYIYTFGRVGYAQGHFYAEFTMFESIHFLLLDWWPWRG